MENRILTATAGKLEGLHSPYTYCSDELVLKMLPLKFAEAFRLMVAFISIHPNSFGVNSLSIFLAVVKQVTHGSTASTTAIQSIASNLGENVMHDCEKILEVLEELQEFQSTVVEIPHAADI